MKVAALTLILAAVGAVPLAGCVDDYGYGPSGYYTGAYYTGFYDDYYGPFYGGYWASDGFFYYSDRDGHRFQRDGGHHFRRDSASGYHPFHGHAPGPGGRGGAPGQGHHH